MNTNSNPNWAAIIDHDLLEPIVRYCKQSPAFVTSAFLTGSYVRGSYNPRRPNVNVYFVAQPHKAIPLRLELASLWEDIRQNVRRAGGDFLIDCHPYTVGYRDPAFCGKPLLTLTTKVLDGTLRNQRYSLPPSIGLGWASGYRILHGETDVLETLKSAPNWDREWAASVHEALGHYKNVLDHLPWALPWLNCPLLLLQESLRYAEEAIRDGVAVALTPDELSRGALFDVLFNWGERAEPFYTERYGASGLQAVRTTARLKAMFDRDDDCSEADAKVAWHDALEVWQVVWNKYLELARALFDERETTFFRVNAFV